MKQIKKENPLFLLVDLFCGFGGTTTGFMDAEINGQKIAKVIACINHDPKAIRSHWLNHKEVVHFEEDIRTLKLEGLQTLVKYYRKLFPNAKLILWASLECTNFSKAKGGQARDADSRTLAEHLNRYVDAINPDYIKIENVVEFESWGPLDENNKPISRNKGIDYMNWKQSIIDMGYNHGNGRREINSADLGAYTSRNRLFLCFAKPGLPIVWPELTHSKKKKGILFGDHLKPWMPVKEVLDFSDEGESIFNRKKPLSDKTLERIYAGLVKYVANGDKNFIAKSYSGRPAGKVIPTTGPAGTITCFGGQQLVQPNFLVKYNSMDKNGFYAAPSVDQPAPVLTTQNRLYLAQCNFLSHYYIHGYNTSIDDACPTLRTKDSVTLIQPDFLLNYNHSSTTNDINTAAPAIVAADKLGVVQPKYFISRDFTNGGSAQSIDQPAGSVMPVPKLNLVEAKPFMMPTNFNNKPTSIDEPAQTITANRKHTYIVNPSHGGHCTSTDAPCPVIVARQDKAPLSYVQAEPGRIAIAVYEEDTEICIKIKEFMVIYELVDIKMRMLRVPELLKIQGFPVSYQMVGNQSDQKKFIGNSVVPLVTKSWCEAMAVPFIETKAA